MYKPGKQNIVADALSRQYCNAMEQTHDTEPIAMETEENPNANSSHGTIHSRESSPRIAIPRTTEPLNAFKIQIELERSNSNETEHNTIFPEYIRYKIKYTNTLSVINQMKNILNRNNVNALYMDPIDEYHLEEVIAEKFPDFKIIST